MCPVVIDSGFTQFKSTRHQLVEHLTEATNLHRHTLSSPPSRHRLSLILFSSSSFQSLNHHHFIPTRHHRFDPRSHRSTVNATGRVGRDMTSRPSLYTTLPPPGPPPRCLCRQPPYPHPLRAHLGLETIPGPHVWTARRSCCRVRHTRIQDTR